MEGSPEVRYFTGTSMRSVLAEVRSVFGKEAMILSQEQNNGRVRVAASGAAASPAARETVDGRRQSLVEAAFNAPAPEANEVRRPPVATHLDTATVLGKLGYSESLIARLPVQARGPEDLGRWVAEELELIEQLPVVGCFRLIGPPGSGKTSALANWAAIVKRNDPDVSIRLISTDVDRLAGTAVMDRLGILLGVSVEHVPAVQLDATLAAQTPAGLTLVDCRSGDTPPCANLQDVLVIPADLEPRRFCQDLEKASAVILTHVDRAITCGAALSGVRQASLALLGLAQSDQLPGGLAVSSRTNIEQIACKGIDLS